MTKSLDYNKEVFSDNGKKMIELVTNAANFLKNADCIETIPSSDEIKNSVVSKYVESEDK